MTSNRMYNQIDAFKRAYRLLRDLKESDEERMILGNFYIDKQLRKKIGDFLDETEHLR